MASPLDHYTITFLLFANGFNDYRLKPNPRFETTAIDIFLNPNYGLDAVAGSSFKGVNVQMRLLVHLSRKSMFKVLMGWCIWEIVGGGMVAGIAHNEPVGSSMFAMHKTNFQVVTSSPHAFIRGVTGSKSHGLILDDHGVANDSVPNFNSAIQSSSNAQVWVLFHELPWVYWDRQIVSDLARGLIEHDASSCRCGQRIGVTKDLENKALKPNLETDMATTSNQKGKMKLWADDIEKTDDKVIVR
ncbi:hypothetical protein TorRG33x02_344270 [Trema orientale]|uniref:DUF4283 domain-containing protein n=1 Tax=Trema orientale TaxID=63057 RepID=A0A2P5AQE9_TREOI|nr:hypothetical protein TorRG33x02_344270 [Trema orientale]